MLRTALGNHFAVKMPRSQCDADGKKLSWYDEKYDCAFDRIGDKGLKTWSYKEIMTQEKMRRRE